MKILNSIRGFAFTLGIASLTSLFFTCKNPVENFKIAINATATSAPSSIRVYDVTTNTRLSVDGSVPVTITGKDAHYIYTPGGYQTFAIFEGQILLSLRNGVNPTPENPIQYQY